MHSFGGHTSRWRGPRSDCGPLRCRIWPDSLHQTASGQRGREGGRRRDGGTHKSQLKGRCDWKLLDRSCHSSSARYFDAGGQRRAWSGPRVALLPPDQLGLESCTARPAAHKKEPPCAAPKKATNIQCNVLQHQRTNRNFSLTAAGASV